RMERMCHKSRLLKSRIFFLTGLDSEAKSPRGPAYVSTQMLADHRHNIRCIPGGGVENGGLRCANPPYKTRPASMWKQLWQKWTIDKPAAFGDWVWQTFVVELAALLDRVTLRQVIAFMPVVILLVAYA